MVNRRPVKKPLDEFVARVKEAVKGDNAAQEIQNASAALLKSYGIQNPVKK